MTTGTGQPEDEDVRRLLEEAGRREEIPEEDLEVIMAASREAWRGRIRSRRPQFVRLLAVAAAFVIIVLGGLLFVRHGSTVTDSPTVAICARVTGDVQVSGIDPERPLRVEASVREGEQIEVREGDVSLLVGGRTSLRLSAGTRVTLESLSKVALSSGTAYVDTGDSGPSLEIATPFGSAKDIGTRFLVRIDVDAGTMDVAVRDGEVIVTRGERQRSVTRGKGLTVWDDGASAERDVSPWADEWSWVVKAGPPFVIEGRTLATYLEWVERETGLEIRFEDAAAAVVARETTLHGSTGELPPGEAVLLVLPGAGLEGEIVDGELRVRPASQ